jgi:hypothetical protein
VLEVHDDPCNRRHAMTALAALAKFQGRYDRRVEIRHEYQTWQNQDTTIRTTTNYTGALGYEIRDGIVYNPDGTVLFK